MIIAACSNRKRIAPDADVQARCLPRAALDVLVADWKERIARADTACKASQLYCGRAFADAASAARTRNDELFIISAGLGVVAAEAEIPSYSLTTASGQLDSVLGRSLDPATPSDWWGRLVGRTSLAAQIEKCSGPILVALPATYLHMISSDLAQLSDKTIERLRIFTASRPEHFSDRLRQVFMPYDNRLDGPDSMVPGTKSDFASRALRHFVETLGVAETQTLAQHVQAVSDHLSGWRRPTMPARKRASDEEILGIIRANWNALGGNRSRLHRLLRDELLVACEQSRFKKLADVIWIEAAA